MSADPPSSPTDSHRFRHWITDVKITPGNSDPSCEFSARMFVNNELVCSLPAIDSSRPLEWSGLLFCDASMASTINLRLCRSVNGRPRHFNFPAVTISEIDEETGEITLELAEAVWVVTIKSLTTAMANRLFSDELERFDAINGVYDSGRSEATVKYLFKNALRFASIAAKALPESTAKISFMICMKAWELLDHQPQLNGSIQTILRDLTGIRDIVDIISQASDSMLTSSMSKSKDAIHGILALLEDVSVYIFNRYTTNELVHIHPERAEENDTYESGSYLARLEGLQRAFYSSWSPTSSLPVNPTRTVTNENELLDASQEQDTRTLCEESTKSDWYEIVTLLRPISPSGFDPEHACMDGTREALLNRIITWTQNRDSPDTLIWISGQAGMGKTAIASSLCQRLYDIRALAGCFFCKQDSLNFNDPLALINNLVCEIAMNCPTYAREVAAAIHANPMLCSSYVGLRYQGLIKGPLQKLKDLLMPTTLVAVVDGLDECGNDSAREKTLEKLHEMSSLVPWLKIIISGRSVVSLQQYFQANRFNATVIHLQDYDASSDIRAYIQAQVSQLADKEHWPSDSIDRLCTMSCSVFLWAKLAVKYIKKSTFPALPRLHKILTNQKSPVSDHFDSLYTNALEAVIGENKDELIDAYLQCISAILAISEREPLTVPDLQYLLLVAGRIDQFTLEQMILNLAPLLFVTDGQQIRFRHPSFKDFITDSSRSGHLHIRLDQYQAEPAACCLQVMQRDLRFNICQLETSHRLNSEVPDLKTRIDLHINKTLRYACTHWVDHFIASPCQALVDEIKKFMEGPQLMYWIETLSLLGRIDLAMKLLCKMTELNLNQFAEWALVISWAKDLHRFILSFYDPITTSTPNLYVSALGLAPRNSQTAMRMRPFFPNTIAVVKGGDTDWHPCIKTTVHPFAVQALSISPDGGTLASGYLDGSLALWSKPSGTCIAKSLVGHRDVVTCVTFSPDSRVVASSSYDGTIRVWDLSRSLQNSDVLSGHSGPVHSIAFFPNGLLIASGSSDRTIRLWDPTTLHQIHGPYFGHSNRVTSVAFSPDSTKLVSGSWDKTIRIWSIDIGSLRLANNPLVITGHSEPVTCAVFSPDGSAVASGSMDKTVQVWDSQTGAKSQAHTLPVKHSDTIASIAFSPDGKYLASCSLDGAIHLWGALTSTFSQPFGHSSPVNAIAFSPDGFHLVSGSTDMTTQIWDTNACAKPTTTGPLVGHSSHVYSVAVNSNGSFIVSGSRDNTVRVWDTQTGAPAGSPLIGHLSYVWCIDIFPNGTQVVSVSEDKSMKLWDTATSTNINTYQHGSVIYCAAFSPDGARIAFGSVDNKVYLWDVMGWKIMGNSLNGHSDMVYSVAFSPDGTSVASGSRDKTVILWDIGSRSRSGSPLSGHTSAVKSVSFSPCGT
ncbi:unnamed protein product [Rhizoctonia solani]|uniref:Nephrocystin 3-like N-terminal domain-containing protein n=1 Tax=Rhizoctonia solani TaxID=456999 RepID=A0A8H2ZZU2_9AGAM|nr:unnamed protein product [Rhizoctonia solani]